MRTARPIRRRVAARAGVLVALYLVALSPLVRTANADSAEDAKGYLEKANTAFALSQFDVAAENYEKAYALGPDPALLYNAAQSYRLAGNKPRALERYQSYQRMYGSEKREEIEKHIADLKKAIEHDQEVANSPPVTTEPPTGDITKVPPLKTDGNTPVLVTGAESRPAERPLTSKPWFWGAVAGGVAVVAVVVLLLASGGDDPASASIGRVDGN